MNQRDEQAEILAGMAAVATGMQAVADADDDALLAALNTFRNMGEARCAIAWLLHTLKDCFQVAFGDDEEAAIDQLRSTADLILNNALPTTAAAHILDAEAARLGIT